MRNYNEKDHLVGLLLGIVATIAVSTTSTMSAVYAVGDGLEKEIERNKSSLKSSLSQDFGREITLADTYVYNGNFDGALYHGLIAHMMHRTLKELEQERQ
ncbi:MAG: hypothetical protein ACM3X1_03675 [Ignavibacteriales bacterium]